MAATINCTDYCLASPNPAAHTSLAHREGADFLFHAGRVGWSHRVRGRRIEPRCEGKIRKSGAPCTIASALCSRVTRPATI